MLTFTSDSNFFKTASFASGPIVIFSPLEVKSTSFSVGLSLAYSILYRRIRRWMYIAPRVYNKRREYWTLYMVCVICVWRVMWLPALRTWLSQVAKHSIFLRTVTNRGVFREFYARFFMNACFVAPSAHIFSCYCTRISLHSRPCP